MSFLGMLYRDSDPSESWNEVIQDAECGQVLDQVESDLLFENDGVRNSQLLKHVEQAELKSQFDNVSNSQLIHDVTVIESRSAM